MTTMRDKLVKIGAEVLRHGRYITFQLAEVAVQMRLFRKILSLIDDLRRRPVPAYAEEIHGEVKTMRKVRLDGEKFGYTGFWTPPTDEYRAIWKVVEEIHSNGGAIWLPSPWIWR